MKKIALIFSMLFLIGCSQSQNNAGAENINWMRDLGAAKKIAQEQNLPVLIDFYTDWCGWCKRLDKDTYGDARVAEALKQFVCVKIDAEKQQNIAQEFNVRGFPSTAFLKPDGSLMEVVPGYMPADGFLELLKGIRAKLEN